MKRKIEYLTYFLYFISNVLMLLNPGVYWDDWALYNMDEKGIMNQFYGNGVYPIGYLHVFLTNISSSPLLYNYLSFFLQLLGVYSLFRIIDNYPLKIKTPVFLYLGILIYAVFPFYDAKITMIVLPYTICLNFFIVATWFLLKYREGNQLIYRILSLLLFFVSFFTNSLLFFYIIPIFFIFFFEDWQKIFSKNYSSCATLVRVVSRRVIKYMDFFLLPFLFWSVRSMLFMPSMQYANSYNEVKLKPLLDIPFRTLKFIYVTGATLLPLLQDFLQSWEVLFIAFFFIVLIYNILPSINKQRKISWTIILWGMFVLFIGIFPYLLVNKFPSYVGYSSRHQLLQGFGLSLLLLTLIFLLPKKLRKSLLASILGIFVAFNIYIHFNYFKGYMKQQVFHEAFQSVIPKRETPTTIIFKDNTTNFALKGNPVAFYALSGILKRSNPHENIMLIREKDLEKYKSQGLFEQIKPYMFQYNLSGYVLKEPEYILKINYSEQKKPILPLFSYYGDYLFGKKERWNKYFDVRLEPFEQ